MDNNDDDALRRAIQMSLEDGETKSARRPVDVVDLTEEDDVWPDFTNSEEMDYYKAIAISMDEGSSSHASLMIEPSYKVCRKYKFQDQKQETPLFVPDDDDDDVVEQSRNGSKHYLSVSDTEDEEDSYAGSATASEEEDKVEKHKDTVKAIATTSTGLGGLDRAQMERERLERAKRDGIRHDPIEPPAKRTRTDHPTHPPQMSLGSSSQNAGKYYYSVVNIGLEYPDGTIKWTHARGYPVENHHITIEQVLQKDTLKAAVLSAFQVLPIPPLIQIDFQWALGKMDPSKTTVVFVAHSESDDTVVLLWLLMSRRVNRGSARRFKLFFPN
jgi:hypothetical protein